MSAAADRYRAHVAAVWASQPADGAHDLGHLARVWTSARAIALDEAAVDWPVLEAAVWFHDLVNLPKDSPDRARASTLSASLELVKEGAMDVKQAEAFADLYLKRRGRGQLLELVP